MDIFVEFPVEGIYNDARPDGVWNPRLGGASLSLEVFHSARFLEGLLCNR